LEFGKPKKWKNKGKTKTIFRTNIRKEKKNLLAFKKTEKLGKIRQRNARILLILKKNRKRKTKQLKGNKN
jgi:hypothetical protein